MATTDLTAISPFPPKNDDIVTLAVRHQRFDILTMALTSSSGYFKNMFRGPSASVLATPKRTVDGAYIVHANPEIFKHVLDHMETNSFPFFWDLKEGFDHGLYARVLQTANFFQMESLVDFIKNQKYESVVKRTITHRCHDATGANVLNDNARLDAGNSIVETLVCGGMKDIWKCPRGHVNGDNCSSGADSWGSTCWPGDPRVTSQIQAVTVITVTTKATFDWTQLCP